ncbi:MAG: thiamine phosphate synthase [Phycisphaerales bacterium]
MFDARLRIIDANVNRAREALRVMEDASRFVLADADLSADIKSARHALRDAIDSSGVDAAAMFAWRDTPGDVGTALSTESEYSRGGMSQVVAAAAKRLTEALRSIEECLKPDRVVDAGAPTGDAARSGASAAKSVERLRYRAYELERRLMTALPALGAPTPPQWRLCVLITESLCEHDTWENVARQCIEGGADCLQLREKSLGDADLLGRARRLVDLARSLAGPAPGRPEGARASVIINDRPDIAVLAGADGVHLGQTDLPVREVRRLLGRTLLVGVSTGTLEQAREAVRAGADYIGIGPMFPTTTKHKPAIAGPELLREVLAAPETSQVPHLAIGGITSENVAELVRIGCKGVAVSSFVQKRQRPAVACQALLDGLASTH